MVIRKRAINALVERMLREAKAHKPPVDVEKIANKLNLRVRYRAFEGDLSGFTIREGNRVTVGINSSHHENRQRFTLAHEIAHVLLHKGEEIIVDRKLHINLRDTEASKAENPEEIEANYFAAQLLMPEGLLINDLRGRKVDIQDDEFLGTLAKRYMVSLQAITYRLVNLGYLIP